MSAAELNPTAVELLRGRNFAHLATINQDGSVQVHPMWVDMEGGRPVMNTAVGRVKERNMRRDPRVTLAVSDAGDPYRYVEIRGVAELVPEGAREHIEALARKYTGQPFKGFQPGVDRIKIVVRPLKVRLSG
ncbi:MAG: PPOX class F420-dependent oxidoreductase [Gaiellales bacterium]